MENTEVKIVKEEKKKKAAHIRMMAEFRDFLKEYKILGIAAGLVIGSAVTTLTQAIVGGLITPLLQMLIPADSLKSLVFNVNGANFQVGFVVSAFINFLVVALMFFIFAKVFMKKEKEAKRPQATMNSGTS